MHNDFWLAGDKPFYCHMWEVNQPFGLFRAIFSQCTRQEHNEWTFSDCPYQKT